MILPLSVMVFDCDLRRVYKRQEKRFFTFLKVLYWMFFYIVFAITYSRPSSVVRFTNLMMMVFPVLSIGYSFLLSKFNSLSYPVAPEAD